MEGIITPSDYERIKTNKKQIQYYIRLYELDGFIRKMDYKSIKERTQGGLFGNMNDFFGLTTDPTYKK